MTDRELLEAAAKAAGMEIDPIDAAHEPSGWVCWNPLADDGDALRLAVKLGLTIDTLATYACCVRFLDGTSEHQTFREYYDDDPLPAVRRVIVRAAALAPQPVEVK